jgi:tetratricopeptide (TPR) repeat protein
MRRISLLLALLSLVPMAAFAMSGYGASGGMGPSFSQAPGRVDLEQAMQLIDRKDYQGAIPHLMRALQARPGNADILNYLGFTSRMIGDYPASLDYYQRALARDPDHKGAHEYLGELYLNMHQPDQARAQLAELVRLCPDGCVERDTLTQSITAYQATAGAPAPTAASAPAQSAPQQPSAPH